MAAINKTTSRTEILVNNIRIGGKAPKSIWKGSTEVKKVQKGSTVVYEKGPITYTLYRSSDVAGTTATLPIVLTSNAGPKTVTTFGGEDWTVADYATGIHLAYYESNTGILQILV